MFAKTAFVALGTNLPFRGLAGARLLAAAVAAMEARTLIVGPVSRAWESPAWPDPAQPAYTNAVAAIDAAGRAPAEVLATLLEVERAFERVREGGRRWAARTLDLDLIDFAGQVRTLPGLTLPHPRCHERAFVLAPLLELAPDWTHPVLRRRGRELLAGLDQAGLRPGPRFA